MSEIFLYAYAFEQDISSWSMRCCTRGKEDLYSTMQNIQQAKQREAEERRLRELEFQQQIEAEERRKKEKYMIVFGIIILVSLSILAIVRNLFL